MQHHIFLVYRLHSECERK